MKLEQQKKRRLAVLADLAALGGTAVWLSLGERGHNHSTLLNCERLGLITRRPIPGPKTFDMTPYGYAAIEQQEPQP